MEKVRRSARHWHLSKSCVFSAMIRGKKQFGARLPFHGNLGTGFFGTMLGLLFRAQNTIPASFLSCWVLWILDSVYLFLCWPNKQLTTRDHGSINKSIYHDLNMSK